MTWWFLTRNQTELPSLLHTVLAGPPHSDSHSSGIGHFLQSSYLVSWMGKGIQGSDVVTQRLWWVVLLVSQTSTEGVSSRCSASPHPSARAQPALSTGPAGH